LGASVLTFRYIEQPVRYNTSLAARPRRTLALGLAVTVLCAVIAGAAFVRADAATKTAAQARFKTSTVDIRYLDCSSASHTPSPTCDLGEANSDKTIVLFGDSHAAMWNPAFDRLGREHGYRVIPVEMAGCPPAELGDFFQPTLGREYPECGPWRERALEAIAKLHPQLIVFGSSADVYASTPEHPLPTGITSAAWTNGIRETASRLNKIGVPFVMIRDTPTPGYNVPDCLSRQAGAIIGGGRACAFDRDAVQPASRSTARAVQEFENGSVIDLNDVICPTRSCQVMRNGLMLYLDDNHLTPAYAASLSGAMWDRLAGVLTSSARG
jgi:hypothetical protein